MAYLHCHTKDCGWSQDDFWTLRFCFAWKSWRKSWWKLGFDIGYNPISRMWNDITWLWKPRWMGLDDWIINDMTEYTGVNVKVRRVKKKRNSKIHLKLIQVGPDGEPVKHPDYYYENQVFSWSWLRIEFVKNWRSFRQMKWWTYKNWQKHKETAVCPKCGLINFDID